MKLTEQDKLPMKKCTTCGQTKSLDKFIKNKQCKNGISGTCRDCGNKYSMEWKRKNSTRISLQRRKRYAETEGLEVKQREQRRKELHPLKVRCQLLRSGMRDRSKTKAIEFDNDLFTVKYLMDSLLKNPNCRCCGKKLDLSFKENKKFNDDSPSIDRVNPDKGYVKDNVAILCWRCNKHKQGSNSDELRKIANFIDSWKIDD